jgi:AcrR family transcriptional regulator
VATAVDLLRRYGLADLTMRRLARELGVAPGALYWHVSNKQELLVEVAELLLVEIPEPPRDQPAPDALASLAIGIREVLLRVPDGADVVALAYALDPLAARPLRDLGHLVRRSGVPSGERDAVVELVLHHILGSIAAQQNRMVAAGVDPDGVRPDAMGEEKAFEVGLGVILRGMTAGPTDRHERG